MALYIVGAGGVGREVLDVALALGIEVFAFLDDALAGQVRRGIPVRGPAEAEDNHAFTVGIADPNARRRLAEQLTRHGLTAATLVHPRATLAPETILGPGSLVSAGAYLSSSVTLGAHAQVHYNATIGHDAALGDRTTVLPGAHISGAVTLGEAVTVGAGAVVLEGRTVEPGATVGAGAVVTRDVKAASVVVGVPARAAGA